MSSLFDLQEILFESHRWYLAFFASNKTSRRPIVTQGGRGHDQRTSTIEDLTTREPITHLQTSFYFSKAHGGHRPA